LALRFFTHPAAGIVGRRRRRINGIDAAVSYITDASDNVEELISDAYTGAYEDLELVDRFTQLWGVLSELDADPLEASLARLLRGRGPHPDLEDALQQLHDDHVGCEDFSWLDEMDDKARPLASLIRPWRHWRH
jgi:hypothetical protein